MIANHYICTLGSGTCIKCNIAYVSSSDSSGVLGYRCEDYQPPDTKMEENNSKYEVREDEGVCLNTLQIESNADRVTRETRNGKEFLHW